MINNILVRLFGQRKFRQFVVICHPRTGSNLLLSYLGTHPNIKAQREIFKKLNGRTIRDVYRTFMRKRPVFIKANGFKIFYDHPEDGNHEELLSLVDSMPDPLIIHLIREDKFRTLVSWKIALKVDQWGTTSPDEIMPAHERIIEISPDEALQFLQHIRKEEKRIHDRFKDKDYLLLTYEQLTGAPEEYLKEICEHLSLEYARMHTRYIRSNPEDVEELVSNYQVLKETGVIDQFYRDQISFRR